MRDALLYAVILGVYCETSHTRSCFCRGALDACAATPAGSLRVVGLLTIEDASERGKVDLGVALAVVELGAV
jgi:hypothetical protein